MCKVLSLYSKSCEVLLPTTKSTFINQNYHVKPILTEKGLSRKIFEYYYLVKYNKAIKILSFHHKIEVLQTFASNICQGKYPV